jgi:soluble P-type ATPase
VRIHVITADTFGKVEEQLAGLPCRIRVLPRDGQDERKLEYVGELGCEGTVCIGNGRNDCLMLRAAALGIAVLQEEGAASAAIGAADAVCPDVVSALDLLRHPLRLIATLRT